MSQNVSSAATGTSVPPLRKCRKDGSLYGRPPEIEEVLAELTRVQPSELLERFRIEDAEAPGYVPSECLVYFIRRPVFGEDENLFRELFLLLRQRVLKAVPVQVLRLPGIRKFGESAAEKEISDAVLQKFLELLCRDRTEYEERLDFYEIRFNQALSLLRITARRKVRKEEKRLEPLGGEEDTNTPSEKVETALRALKNSEDGIDSDYRLRLYAAITSLPLEERRVIELILQDLPIESKDEEVDTIGKTLKCSTKTVWNRRARAFKKLHDALKEEDDA